MIFSKKRNKPRTTKNSVTAFEFQTYFDAILAERKDCLILSENHRGNDPNTLRKKFLDSILWFSQYSDNPKVILYKLLKYHLRFVNRSGLGLLVKVNSASLSAELDLLTPDMVMRIQASNFRTNDHMVRAYIAEQSLQYKANPAKYDHEIEVILSKAKKEQREVHLLDREDTNTIARMEKIERLKTMQEDVVKEEPVPLLKRVKKSTLAPKAAAPIQTWTIPLKAFLENPNKVGLFTLTGLSLTDTEVRQASLLITRHGIPESKFKVTGTFIRIFKDANNSGARG